MEKPIVVERSTEVKANIVSLYDEKSLVGYRVSFVPPAHSEEEAAIELAVFGPRSVTLEPKRHGDGLVEVAFEVRDPDAVVAGRRIAEDWKRKREKRPSLEQEESAARAAEEADKKALPSADDLDAVASEKRLQDKSSGPVA